VPKAGIVAGPPACWASFRCVASGRSLLQGHHVRAYELAGLTRSLRRDRLPDPGNRAGRELFGGTMRSQVRNIHDEGA